MTTNNNICFYLNGMALIKKSNGFGPFVYLLINSGRMICSGASGTASRPSFSLGTPASMSFK
jgi:hypothetical protein